MANKLTLTFTKGESLFITESLEQLRSEIRQAIKEHGDDEDGGYVVAPGHQLSIMSKKRWNR